MFIDFYTKEANTQPQSQNLEVFLNTITCSMTYQLLTLFDNVTFEESIHIMCGDFPFCFCKSRVARSMRFDRGLKVYYVNKKVGRLMNLPNDEMSSFTAQQGVWK